MPHILQPVAQVQSSQTQPQALPVNSQQNPTDPIWTAVGQYGVGVAALLALFKAYADYQLKAAVEDRALKNKETNHDLETKERIYGNVISQNEKLSTSQGQLLNTFIAKALNQSEITNEQITELIKTIGTLTEAIKYLSDSQTQQLDLLHEVKEAVESHRSVNEHLIEGFNSAIESLSLQTNLINQVLVISETLSNALEQTNVRA